MSVDQKLVNVSQNNYYTHHDHYEISLYVSLYASAAAHNNLDNILLNK